jgi:propanol-preferring alcohol dehydrogenase
MFILFRNLFSAAEAAPLLCAGAVDYRSLKLTELIDGENLGFTGFGASAHLALKLARFKFPGFGDLRFYPK